MTRNEILSMKDSVAFFEGVSKSGNDWLVHGFNDSKLAFVARNQGEHDKEFFDVALLPLNEAIKKAKYFCSR